MRWTDETIAEAILAREGGGLSMARGEVESEDPSLLRAAERRYGEWEDAIRAVKRNGVNGVNRPTSKNVEARENASPKVASARAQGKRVPGGKWNVEATRAAILERHRAGKPLDLASANKEQSTLVAAAYLHWDSWYGALEVCGIDSSRWRSQRYHGPLGKRDGDPGMSRLVERIKRRAELGKSLDASVVVAEELDLLMAANRECGSWERAVARAKAEDRE